jgi:hypothetical protein
MSGDYEPSASSVRLSKGEREHAEAAGSLGRGIRETKAQDVEAEKSEGH